MACLPSSAASQGVTHSPQVPRTGRVTDGDGRVLTRMIQVQIISALEKLSAAMSIGAWRANQRGRERAHRPRPR